MPLANAVAGTWLLLSPALAVAAWVVAGPARRDRVVWAGMTLLFPPLFLLLLARRATGRPPVPPARERARPAPVEAPPEEALAALPDAFHACGDCGYLGVRAPGVQDGVFAGGGELVEWVCPRCHFRGLAPRFHDRGDYVRFLRELAAAGAPS